MYTQFITWLLTLAATPNAIDIEAPKASACVSVAYAASRCHAIQDERVTNAKQNARIGAALGAVGAGREPEKQTSEPNEGKAERGDAGVLQQSPQTMAPNCTNGQCFPVPSVRRRMR